MPRDGAAIDDLATLMMLGFACRHHELSPMTATKQKRKKRILIDDDGVDYFVALLLTFSLRHVVIC
jgi:hypothetical protein